MTALRTPAAFDDPMVAQLHQDRLEDAKHRQLVQAPLRTGMARPDPLQLGFDVTIEGALLTRCGTPSRWLFAVEPLTKGAAWEITAVPDLRMQCRDVARGLGGGV